MKKAVTFIVLIFAFICLYISYEESSYYKIFGINSADEINIDLNKNFIFDEQDTYKVEDIHTIKEYSENIDADKRFLLEYLAQQYAEKSTKNLFAQVKDNSLYINGKEYRKLLLNSGLFFENTPESITQFKETINKYNPEEYVILNVRSNKYHKINCINGKSIKSYKIIKRDEIKNTYTKAKCCSDDKNVNILSQNKIIKNNNLNNGDIKVVFIDMSELKPNNKCNNEACKILVNEIDNAKESINFAIYGFNNQPHIYNALSNAAKRGVKIKWITNFDKSENAYYPELEKLKELLPNYKTNEGEQNKSLMHNKFFIFDDKKVYTGSANISSTDLSNFNANYVILINSNAVAQIFKSEFNQMYSGKFSNNKSQINDKIVILDNGIKLTILFSPKDYISTNYISDLIKNANKYIYMPIFLITDKNIKKELIEAKKRNIDIKIISDATSSTSKYSINNELKQNGISVKTENYAGKMHAKSLIIDDKYTIIGSMNFTSSGNKRNDENCIIIDDIKTAKYMKNTFLDIWNKIPDKYLHYNPKAESKESIGSCFDGIDNDFDGKIDNYDEGCFIKQ